MRRFPAFAAATCRGGYGAIYDLTPDGNPILDRSGQVEGLYFAAGFSGHGFKLSPVVGRMMAELILDGRSKDHDIRRFRLSRFRRLLWLGLLVFLPVPFISVQPGLVPVIRLLLLRTNSGVIRIQISESC